MPDIDISKIKVGDRITLGGEFEVTHLDAQDTYRPVRVTLPGGGLWLHPAVITAHHPKPKPLAVGDKVKDNGGLVWEIVGQKRSNEAPVEHRVYEYPLWRPLWGFASRHDEAVESWERVS